MVKKGAKGRPRPSTKLVRARERPSSPFADDCILATMFVGEEHGCVVHPKLWLASTTLRHGTLRPQLVWLEEVAPGEYETGASIGERFEATSVGHVWMTWQAKSKTWFVGSALGTEPSTENLDTVLDILTEWKPKLSAEVIKAFMAEYCSIYV